MNSSPTSSPTSRRKAITAIPSTTATSTATTEFSSHHNGSSRNNNDRLKQPPLLHQSSSTASSASTTTTGNAVSTLFRRRRSSSRYSYAAIMLVLLCGMFVIRQLSNTTAVSTTSTTLMVVDIMSGSTSSSRDDGSDVWDPTLAFLQLGTNTASSSSSSSGNPMFDELKMLRMGKATKLPPQKDDASQLFHLASFYDEEQQQQGYNNKNLHVHDENLSPAVWKHMMRAYGIRSVLDVGCGVGASTAWFLLHGMQDVVCVEAHPTAIQQSLIPKALEQRAQSASSKVDQLQEHLVQHDFTRGPWWPDHRTYDAAWVVDFIGYTSRQYQYNYLTALRKTALVFVTLTTPPSSSSDEESRRQQQSLQQQHAVEIHHDDWWMLKFQSWGFQYREDLTQEIIQIAKSSSVATSSSSSSHGNGVAMGTRIAHAIKVFVNPAVASLPEHMHLFPEHGCTDGLEKVPGKSDEYRWKQRACGGESSSETTTTNHATAADGSRGGGSSLTTALLDEETEQQMTRTWFTLIQKQHTQEEGQSSQQQTATGQAGKPTPTTASTTTTLTSGAQQQRSPLNPSATSADKDGADPLRNHVVTRWRAGEIKTVEELGGKVPVYPWPYAEMGVNTAEAKHLKENGLNESTVLDLTLDMYNFDSNVVWVGDTGYPYGWNKWCSEFMTRIQQAKQERIDQGITILKWPIMIVDWTDNDVKQKCPEIEDLMGTNNVYYTKRGMVKSRRFDNRTKWVASGKLADAVWRGKTYVHTPLAVRTDTVEALQTTLRRDHNNLTLIDPIERILDRPVDVTHLWPLDNRGVGTVMSELRHRVSEVITEMGNSSNLNVYVGLAGGAARTGRRDVQSTYLNAMLRTKILVITQRDNWEDHYRLFEGLITGAMIMTDRMLTLPARLQHEKSIVEFTSANDLKQKILYYLQHTEERQAIAAQGRLISMTYHRSWHRMEEIVFGEIVSKCPPFRDTSACPWIVHAHEATASTTV